jgi:hypothetical protein
VFITQITIGKPVKTINFFAFSVHYSLMTAHDLGLARRGLLAWLAFRCRYTRHPQQTFVVGFARYLAANIGPQHQAEFIRQLLFIL